MRTSIALMVAALLLGGCAAMRDPDEFGARPEKPMYQALHEVKATDAQRLAVQAAYDRFHGKLEDLQSHSRALIGEWRALVRRGPQFTELVRGLSERWAALAAERLQLESAFEQEVAGILDESQWRDWQGFMAARPDYGSDRVGVNLDDRRRGP
jgi:hypothetical protein